MKMIVMMNDEGWRIIVGMNMIKDALYDIGYAYFFQTTVFIFFLSLA